MKPPDEIRRELVLQWINKADEDFAAPPVHSPPSSEYFAMLILFGAAAACHRTSSFPAARGR
jgi:hypothetical protein